jgi:hypothetical protein
MTPETNATRSSVKRSPETAQTSKGKQINPFSEQEKHGDAAQRRKPQTEQESHGGSVQQRATTGDDDTAG